MNDYTYSVRIARIDYERAVGEEAFADGFHYYYTEPRGLEDTEELLIYLPGAPLGELPQEFRGWVDHGDQGRRCSLMPSTTRRTSRDFSAGIWYGRSFTA